MRASLGTWNVEALCRRFDHEEWRPGRIDSPLLHKIKQSEQTPRPIVCTTVSGYLKYGLDLRLLKCFLNVFKYVRNLPLGCTHAEGATPRPVSSPLRSFKHTQRRPYLDFEDPPATEMVPAVKKKRKRRQSKGRPHKNDFRFPSFPYVYPTSEKTPTLRFIALAMSWHRHRDRLRPPVSAQPETLLSQQNA